LLSSWDDVTIRVGPALGVRTPALVTPSTPSYPRTRRRREDTPTTSHEAAVFKRVVGTSLMALLLAAICGCAAFPLLSVPASMRGMAPADEASHGIHDALFATFVPLDSVPIDVETRGLALTARDRLWAPRAPSPEFGSALAAMTRLDVVAHHSARLRSLIARAGEHRFDRLTAADQTAVIRILL